MSLRIALLVTLLPLCGGCNRSSGLVSPSDNQPSGQSSQPPVVDVQRPASNAIVETTFDDLKFEMEKEGKFERSMLTPEVEKRLDENIRIRGYIYPTLKKKGIKQFVLVRDNLECCFGPGAALFDCILVHMKEGKTAEFSIRPVAVEGKFTFEEFIDYDGTTRAIYRLDGESVQ